MKRNILIWNLMCLTALFIVGCSSDPDDHVWSKDYDIEWPVTTIESVQPLSASPGATLTVTGKNMQYTHYFYIGTAACEILSKSDGQLTVKVPTGLSVSSEIALMNLYRRRYVYNDGNNPILFVPVP